MKLWLKILFLYSLPVLTFFSVFFIYAISYGKTIELFTSLLTFMFFITFSLSSYLGFSSYEGLKKKSYNKFIKVFIVLLPLLIEIIIILVISFLFRDELNF